MWPLEPKPQSEVDCPGPWRFYHDQSAFIGHPVPHFASPKAAHPQRMKTESLLSWHCPRGSSQRWAPGALFLRCCSMTLLDNRTNAKLTLAPPEPLTSVSFLH